MTFIWLIIAILLMIGEIYTPGFFLFCISIGALSAAATALVIKLNSQKVLYRLLGQRNA